MESIIEKANSVRKISERMRLVFVSGNFNIIHPGHLRLINFAKSCGDVLVIGLTDDQSPGVMVGFDDRRASLISLESVDKVVKLFAHELVPFIKLLKPDVIVKGKEHEHGPNPEREIVLAYGGHLIFSAGEATFSSRDLIRKELANRLAVPLRSNPDFLKRRHSNIKKLKGYLDLFADRRLCVVGDLIMDEYIYCDPIGMSQEDPTIVVTPVERQTFLGGAGIVAAHLRGLGAQTILFSVVGQDAMADIAELMIKKYDLGGYRFRDSSRPTILKQRFRANNKTLLRVSHLRSHDIEKEHQQELMEKFSDSLSETEAVIFSDFNYGCLPQSFVEQATRLCGQKGIPVFADSQASSQIGDVSRFRNAEFLSATEREARLALNDFRSGLQHISNALLEKSNAKGLILKLAAEGLLALSRVPSLETDDLPAMNSNPVDVAGAGDALLASAALTNLCGGSIWEAAYIGSLAAAIQVSRVGNTPLTIADLSRELEVD